MQCSKSQRNKHFHAQQNGGGKANNVAEEGLTPSTFSDFYIRRLRNLSYNTQNRGRVVLLYPVY